MPVVGGRLIAAGSELLRVTTVEGVNAVRSNLSLKGLRSVVWIARSTARSIMWARLASDLVASWWRHTARKEVERSRAVLCGWRSILLRVRSCEGRART